MHAYPANCHQYRPPITCFTRRELMELLCDAWAARPAWQLDTLRFPLTVMLGDPDPSVRGGVLKHWGAVLPRSAAARMSALLQLSGDPGLAERPAWREQLHGRWGAAAATLVLRLVEVGSLKCCMYQVIFVKCR